MVISDDGLLFTGQKQPEKTDKYDYNRFGKKGKRVGQASIDILSKPHAEQTVGETLDAFGPDYARQIEECIDQHAHKYTNPWYLFVLTKKEYLLENVVRNWFIPRQTAPHAFDMMEQYSNFTKTLYIVDSEKGKIKLCWSLPGFTDCITVAAHPELYSPELVQWIEECFTRKLDKDKYSFDE